MDNKMIDMQLTNNKLIDRGTRIIMQRLALSYDRAKHLLEEYGSVRKALEINKRKK
jgi:N-acetylmuramic acid 6-phosphate etherase